MKRIKIGLLPRILLAIALGVGCGFFFPEFLPPDVLVHAGNRHFAPVGKCA